MAVRVFMRFGEKEGLICPCHVSSHMSSPIREGGRGELRRRGKEGEFGRNAKDEIGEIEVERGRRPNWSRKLFREGGKRKRERRR